MIVVEHSPLNARLVQRSLGKNCFVAEVVEAAVGPADSIAFFEENEESNVGRVGFNGRTFLMLSMQTVLHKLPAGGSINLVELDIEGGEEALLEGDLAGLERVRAVIAEFNPTLMDYPWVIRRLQGAGFRYIATG